MKQAWIVGTIMLYVILQIINMSLQASTTVNGSMWGVFNSMWHLELSQNVVATAVSSFFAPAAMAIAAITSFIRVVLMLYPAIFSGNYIWFWWIVCFPVSISFIIVFIMSIRGVSSA